MTDTPSAPPPPPAPPPSSQPPATPPPPPPEERGARERRILGGLRTGAREGDAAGARALGALGGAAEALHLQVVETPFTGKRALVGHVLGMRMLIPAQGIHGPRETPALLYLFADALGIRPTDDAPMSAVPLYGLHIVMPHVAMARWIYKAGRTAHANLDLEKQDRDVEEVLRDATVDDFAAADDKLVVVAAPAQTAPVHLYQHLGFVRLSLTTPAGAVVRMKSALPESAKSYARMLEVFEKIDWASPLSTELPARETSD